MLCIKQTLHNNKMLGDHALCWRKMLTTNTDKTWFLKSGYSLRYSESSEEVMEWFRLLEWLEQLSRLKNNSFPLYRDQKEKETSTYDRKIRIDLNINQSIFVTGFAIKYIFFPSFPRKHSVGNNFVFFECNYQPGDWLPRSHTFLAHWPGSQVSSRH